ncbi:MAG: class I SAM-dependent methyltransferase [Miltoncostaeaceae bacterium]
MTTREPYLEYVEDRDFADGYRIYQQRYAETPRESDRALVELVDRLVVDVEEPRVLDVGCSTGNLLRHLGRGVPAARLSGGDLMEAHLEEARRDPALEGVSLRRMDLLDLGVEEAFDIVIANAVIYLFDGETLGNALSSIATALRPGGAFVAFDFVHPFEQELAVHESSATHPDGITLHMRSERTLDRAMAGAGLRLEEVNPFEIGIDLPPPGDPAETTSRTIATADGRRLLFRGTLFQPWAHIVARKAG